ncbi:ThuA domain-containing protein [Pelagicoccus sp. SDUM812005]|uniref:ThuA domain-containing protein n=1 Tax=Pelagicoccus sp. SDUM812005 TaxID=3041257 RepID=UPI00280E7C27|nr:ThuA domain-containing protein [Pelagicoccus sp. SDUM812005]MDQ8183580.1 ThuA domain-containing protein [Pelagicoccus sp. SDUM812005]
MKRIYAFLLSLLFCFAALHLQADPETKNVLLLSGKKTHGYGHHECNSDISVLENLLQRQSKARFDTQLFLDGAWPEPSQLEEADAIVIICDGDANHLLKDRMDEFDALQERNSDLGLLFVHYATVPFGRKEPDFKGTYFNKWIGGFYAGDSKSKTLTKYSHIEGKLAAHPVNRGVEPYRIFDEIYYRMEFVKDIVPVVVAEPLDEVPTFHNLIEQKRFEKDHSLVASFESERERTIFWSYERAGGGRSLGTTLGHIHRNFWTNEDIRKQMVNSVAWISGLDVPEEGFDALELTEEQLNLNHSAPKAK